IFIFVNTSATLKKTAGGMCMVLDEERISMKIQAMGRAVMEFSLADLPMTQQNIIDKLKQYRKETGNVIGKGANRDAAELVRKGQ
uniref:hypothetical protein n=1 Tax=Enterobacter hormaechei TaxID=158836 RepID=UPI001FB07E8F